MHAPVCAPRLRMPLRARHCARGSEIHPPAVLPPPRHRVLSMKIALRPLPLNDGSPWEAGRYEGPVAGGEPPLQGRAGFSALRAAL